MTAEGAWDAVSPFLIAFSITLLSIFMIPYSSLKAYDDARKIRLEGYKEKRKNKGGLTIVQMLYAGFNYHWIVPIIVYFVCVFLAVLGFVLLKHEGYTWANAVDDEYNVPALFLGFWITIAITAWWVSDFLSLCLDRCSPKFILLFGTWILHLAVWIGMVVLHPYGWFQIPLFLAITAAVFAYVKMFFHCNNRYVTINTDPCSEDYGKLSACKEE